ncbi:DUF2515 domain-containing protein [Paenibacillus sedimenti]|uniref:DUF2515 family protein n=1 Tax=Paenibacillus sedimenti TaxID=2770274 RepID=A0A926KUB4_9BACL|nr:DUF2515 domain-containing protein [Paenibacillus sedimenti]MBD0383448.1 DUF2515 family protein [Paenibacillus sedimenti]
MGGTADRGKRSILRILGKLVQLPKALLHLLKYEASSMTDSAQKTDSLETIPVSPETIQRLEKGWKQQLKLQHAESAGTQLSAEEKQIVKRLKEATHRENRNNVIRTKAYWTAYREHPELHWALLAHMVSRNGGWTMTDLRGELLPHLLSDEQAENMFAFLERANGLIFHDAYPQLLLYRESKERKRNLFHLLPHFGVSAWMEPVWNDFWTHQDSAALTISLIINEQNYIEKRIVQNNWYQQSVLSTPLFKTQGWLQLNQVGFPFLADHGASAPPRLAGLILENFADLGERIEFGKSLYAILFGVPAVHQGVLRFAESSPHTGSRADYWPHLFAAIRKAPPETSYQERLNGCVLKKGAAPLYSPPLAQAWPDRRLEPAEPEDWFVDVRKPLAHMCPIAVPSPFELTNESCAALNMIELAVLAEQAIQLS